MRLSKREYIGVDISNATMQAVSLTRSGKGMRLTAARSKSLAAGLVQSNQREPNLPRPDDFISVVRELLGPLGGQEERISLSLPDSSGRLFLHEMETIFKSRDEGLDILRWKLKGSLPAAPKDVCLDYQVLNKNENGRYRMLVSVIATTVLEQYEKLFNEAGYQPLVVDFHSLNVLGYYRTQFDFNEDLVLTVVDGTTLAFKYFQNGQLVMQRYRDVGCSTERVFQEINRSVAGNREKHPSLSRAKVYLHSDWEQMESLQEAVAAVLEKPVQVLDPRIEKLSIDSAVIQPHQGRSLVAALGAAERLM